MAIGNSTSSDKQRAAAPLDDLVRRVGKSKDDAKTRSLCEELAMSEQNELRSRQSLKFTASSGLYCFSDKAHPLLALDQLESRLRQLYSLLSVATADDFDVWAWKIQLEYLTACRDLAAGCKELLPLLGIGQGKQPSDTGPST